MLHTRIQALFIACVLAASGPFGGVSGAFAEDVFISSPVTSQQIIMNAVDAGDVRRLVGHFDFIRTLRSIDPNIVPDKRIDLGFRDQNGNTPLIRAAMQGNPDMVRFLVDNGADINAVNSSNEDAVVTSYTHEHFAVTKYLLAQGAVDPYHIAQMLPEVTIEQPVAVQQVADASGAAQPVAKTFVRESAIGYIGVGAVVAGVGGAAALAAGGGGSTAAVSTAATFTSSPLNPQNLDPATFVTSEALNQQGIVGMNTQYALARGYDGSIYSRNADGTLVTGTASGFVKVAVVDTGVDLTHPDLVNNLLVANSKTCDNTGCVAGGSYPAAGSENWHGTAVAGIIAAQRNGTGIYGVASQAKIIAISFADASGNLTFGDTPGISSALDSGAQVINGSYGFPNITPPSAAPLTVRGAIGNTYGGTTAEAQYQRGVNAHAIFVYAAGNDSAPGAIVANPDLPAGLPYYFQGAVAPTGITQANYDIANPNHYDWSKNWVAAVSVNSNNTISSFSNQCGVAMNWCLAAPGEITMSTTIGGGYTGAIQGTSFAAPNIAGAVAVMLGAFPQLTPEKALQILFSTATDLGAAGVDPVYGHGLVNLRKATSPTEGGWSLTSLSGNSFTFNGSGLGLSAPFGNAAVPFSQSKVQFLDAYGKNYTIPLSVVVASVARTKTAYDKLANLKAPLADNAMNLTEHSSLSFSTEAVRNNTPETQQNKLSKFSYFSDIPVSGDSDTKASVSVNYKTSLTDSVMPPDQPRIASDALKNPYLNLVDSVNSSVMQYIDGHKSVVMAGYFGKLNRDEYQYRYGQSKGVSGVFSELTLADDDNKSKISVDNGVTIEKNSLLGAEASGAFSIDKSVTYYTGVSGKLAVNDHMSLIANYNIGLTKVSAARDSIVTSFNNIMSNAFAAGSEFYNVVQDKDTFGILVSQPLRVASGGASLVLPSGVASDGSMFFESNNINLAPSARELDFEGYYNLKKDENSELGLDFMFRFEPNNTTSGNDATILATYKMNFRSDKLSF